MIMAYVAQVYQPLQTLTTKATEMQAGLASLERAFMLLDQEPEISEEKGALAHVRSGRAYVYRPLLSRRQATQNQVRDVIARFFDGQPVKLVESVLENEVKERDELKNIKCLLEARHEHQLA